MSNTLQRPGQVMRVGSFPVAAVYDRRLYCRGAEKPAVTDRRYSTGIGYSTLGWTGVDFSELMRKARKTVLTILIFTVTPLLHAQRPGADAVVAADGSGDYRTLQEAINAVPQTTSADRRW